MAPGRRYLAQIDAFGSRPFPAAALPVERESGRSARQGAQQPKATRAREVAP